jgi:hypothetical protein
VTLLGQLSPEVQRQAATKYKPDEGYDPWANFNMLWNDPFNAPK